jgi:penicillin-binding protein 2
MRSKKFFIYLLILLPFLILEARLLQIQIISQKDFTPHKSGGRVYIDIKLAPRGRILDRNGVVLASNRVSFDLYLIPYVFEKDKDGLKKVCLLLDIKPDDALNRLNKAYQRIYRYVLKNFGKRHRKKALEREKKLPRLFYRDIPTSVAYQIETQPEIYPGLMVKE